MEMVGHLTASLVQAGVEEGPVGPLDSGEGTLQASGVGFQTKTNQENRGESFHISAFGKLMQRSCVCDHN